ncbi:hypothetical protein [Thioclava sp. GXIMD2076]|uniref:hypothetical protein n=1 Tax=Thioclava sp. GXIMD2076 TaxID=3131931 RepID=UPI0030CA9AAF
MTTTKDAVLALTETAAGEIASSWAYNKRAKTFALTPVEGITALLAPNWGFKSWIARTEPRLDLFSERVSSTHRLLSGQRDAVAVLTLVNQQFWRSCGQRGYPQSFMEDLAGYPATAGDREISDVPAYIQQLTSCAEHYLSSGFDLGDEWQFLRSCPKNWVYYSPFYRQDPRAFVLIQLLQGNTQAMAQFLTQTDLPSEFRESLMPTFAAYEANLAKLKLH